MPYGGDLRGVQEPMLVTLFVRPPSWEALGGSRLVEAAVRAGASGVLLALREACLRGPYAAEVGLMQLLQSFLRTREAQPLVMLVGAMPLVPRQCRAAAPCTDCAHAPTSMQAS